VGRPAWVYGLGGHGHGLGPRYRRPSTTHACASGCLGFFARAGNFESPHHFPKWVDRFQIAPRCQRLWLRVINVFFTATSESRRLSRSLVCRRPPFLAAASETLRDVALGISGRKWCTATPLHRWYDVFSFSLFFLADFLICSQATTLLADGHGRLLP
jgi:hypothetical protein